MLAKWTEKLAGGPQAGRSYFPTSIAKVKGMGRHQQEELVECVKCVSVWLGIVWEVGASG